MSTPRHAQRPTAQPTGPNRLTRALTVDCDAARSLAERVERFGGVERYEAIDTEPIPEDEPFDWSVVAPLDHERVDAVLTALDQVTTGHGLFEDVPEYATIMRRLLARAARCPAGTIRRRSSTDRIAAGLAWIALSINNDGGRHRGQVTAGLTWHLFDVGDCGTLARQMAGALGMLGTQLDAPSRRRRVICTGDVELLRGRYRFSEIWLRDQLLEQIDTHLTRRAENAVVRFTPEGLVVRARDADFAMCIAVDGHAGEPQVAIALGADPIEPDEAFALSLGDATALLESLQRAIDIHMN